MRPVRCAAWMWYRGDHFHGFQAQPEGVSVQQAIASALRAVGAREVVVPSGRTDRGVHARMQVVGVRLPPDVEPEGFARAVNDLSPRSLGVVAAAPAPPNFHPLWSATEKEYRYRVLLGAAEAPPQWRGFAWEVREHARIAGRAATPERFAEALARFEGAHDFIGFHEKTSPRRVRTLSAATLGEIAPGVFEARLTGSGFARHQVRYLVGAAALVASGVIDASIVEESLAIGATFPGLKAPAEALVLWAVRYPAEVDPFSASEREGARGVPKAPPFVSR